MNPQPIEPIVGWTCVTPGCELVGHFCDEPAFCSICLCDLVAVYDTTGEVVHA